MRHPYSVAGQIGRRLWCSPGDLGVFPLHFRLRSMVSIAPLRACGLTNGMHHRPCPPATKPRRGLTPSSSAGFADERALGRRAGAIVAFQSQSTYRSGPCWSERRFPMPVNAFSAAVSVTWGGAAVGCSRCLPSPVARRGGGRRAGWLRIGRARRFPSFTCYSWRPEPMAFRSANGCKLHGDIRKRGRGGGGPLLLLCRWPRTLRP